MSPRATKKSAGTRQKATRPTPASAAVSEASRYCVLKVTQAALAEWFEITTRQVQNLEARGLPCEGGRSTKLYPIPDAVLWYRSYRARVMARSSSFDTVTYLDPRIARAEHALECARDAVKFDARERKMYGRTLTEAEVEALAEREQYLAGPQYLTALAAGRPLPSLLDEEEM